MIYTKSPNLEYKFNKKTTLENKSKDNLNIKITLLILLRKGTIMKMKRKLNHQKQKNQPLMIKTLK